jgi:hypothetical protein
MADIFDHFRDVYIIHAAVTCPLFAFTGVKWSDVYLCKSGGIFTRRGRGVEELMREVTVMPAIRHGKTERYFWPQDLDVLPCVVLSELGDCSLSPFDAMFDSWALFR